jgi:hypothetical protein
LCHALSPKALKRERSNSIQIDIDLHLKDVEPGLYLSLLALLQGLPNAQQIAMDESDASVKIADQAVKGFDPPAKP